MSLAALSLADRSASLSIAKCILEACIGITVIQGTLHLTVICTRLARVRIGLVVSVFVFSLAIPMLIAFFGLVDWRWCCSSSPGQDKVIARTAEDSTVTSID